MNTSFHTSRADGRSDRQVVFELMQDAEPGTLFLFARIADALQVGVSDLITHERACAAARSANALLLRERQRSTVAVRGRGYRVIQASEHVGVAVQRKQRAGHQLRAGLALLQRCRLDELSDKERQRHEGFTLAIAGVVTAVDYIHARQQRQEKVIDSLTRRLDKLDGGAEASSAA